MIGEIRDSETAEIAVRAAMTGHLVLSTLHTNSAVNAVTRLIDMGVEPFLVSSSVHCIVAQRLVRRICPRCSSDHTPLEEESNLLRQHGLHAHKLRRGTGCGDCSRSGYKGRLAIHEILLVDDTLRSMILQRRSDSEYRAYAVQNGMIPMMQDGLAKVAAGLTTFSEVFRVVGSDI
jgi:type IV pilus assembly protein PilB